MKLYTFVPLNIQRTKSTNLQHESSGTITKHSEAFLEMDAVTFCFSCSEYKIITLFTHCLEYEEYQFTSSGTPSGLHLSWECGVVHCWRFYY